MKHCDFPVRYENVDQRIKLKVNHLTCENLGVKDIRNFPMPIDPRLTHVGPIKTLGFLGVPSPYCHDH